MKTRSLIATALILAGNGAARAASIPTPSEFLGITVGADREVADYRQILAYFKALDAASPRVELEMLGKTTLGEDLFLAAISSEKNLANKKRLQQIARKIADPRGLGEAEAQALVREGKLFLFVTCNIHSTEIGASQMAMEWAHALATAEDAETKRRLDEVVLLLLPSINPDGQIMETEWYRKNLGTRYEGGRMPWLYHHYVGHDNNRDWFMLTQKETQAVTRAVYHEWLPQVWLDEHQMGQTGPRIFVPPQAEPVDPDIHPLVWRDINLIGANMAFRLEQARKSGVIYGYVFDAYWPGGTKNTAWWKNVSGLLTEVASVRFATPVRIEPNELSGGGKGLVEYGTQVNFPNPWPGGSWRLRDIMDYERIASDAILESCAERRADFLKNALTRARDAIASFDAKDAFRIPAAQRDTAGAARLAGLLAEHGVELRTAENGDAYVPLAQPYGRFVNELLTPQRYPETKLVAGKDIVRPYDVSAWTLPLMMGVSVERTTLPAGLSPWKTVAPSLSTHAAAFALAPGSPETARLVNAALRGGQTRIARVATNAGGREWPAGTVFLDGAAAKAAAVKAVPGQTWTAVPALPDTAEPLRAPRVGVYKPWAASMDEGWTRLVLERFGFEPVSLDNAAMKGGRLRQKLDAVILPDLDKDVILDGRSKPDDGERRYTIDFPPEYAGGIGDDGARALQEFVQGGGTLVALDSAGSLPIARMNLPVRDVLEKVPPKEFLCPGSILKMRLDTTHPLAYGMPEEIAGYFASSPAYATQIPGAELDRRVIAHYPDEPLLLSGFLRGEERLRGKAAAVEVTLGDGRVVLLGFRVQNRAWTHGTYRLLFNALERAAWEREGGGPAR